MLGPLAIDTISCIHAYTYTKLSYSNGGVCQQHLDAYIQVRAPMHCLRRVILSFIGALLSHQMTKLDTIVFHEHVHSVHMHMKSRHTYASIMCAHTC